MSDSPGRRLGDFKDRHPSRRNRCNRALALLLAGVLAALAACGDPEPNRQPGRAEPQSFAVGGLPRGELHLGSSRNLSLEVELALTAADQARGLMNVAAIPDDYGMVFLWDTAGMRSFHMKNTLIPLDIAWWGHDGTIVDIQTMTPCTGEPCPAYTPRAPHIAAVEVNGGLLQQAGVGVGDPVSLVRSEDGTL